MKRVAWLLWGMSACAAWGQEYDAGSRRSALIVSAEYAHTSSPIILGAAGNRRIAGVAAGYARTLYRGERLEFDYDFEVRPVEMIQDPVETVTETITFAGQAPNGPFPTSSGPVKNACVSGDVSQSSGQPVVTIVLHRACSTRWTYTGGVSPLGMRLAFGPRHRVYSYLLANAGFLIATRQVPANYSSQFNFTFEFGAGLALRRSGWMADYRLRHLSNGGLGISNPGIDSQIMRLSRRF